MACVTTVPKAGQAALVLSDGTARVLEADLSIGRAPDNDLQLTPKSVSRRHARLTRRQGRWYLEDRGSRNGTYLNGVRLQPGALQPLRHGDTIAIALEPLLFWQAGRVDPEDTTPPESEQPLAARPLSPLQAQIVRILCEPWLAGGSLDELPSNEAIAARLGTPGAAETVKAALRRIYAKGGLTDGSPYAKRRALCRVARQRGWI